MASTGPERKAARQAAVEVPRRAGEPLRSRARVVEVKGVRLAWKTPGTYALRERSEP